MLGTVRDQLHPFGLQAVGSEGAQDVCQPLRAVAQGKTTPVFHQPSGGGAQLLQRTGLLAPGRAAALPAVHGIVGRVGDNQVKASRREGSGTQVAGEDLSRQTVGLQILPGSLGGERVDVHASEGESVRPPGQQQEQRSAARAQVAHPPAGLYCCESSQRQGVAPQGKDARPPGKSIRAELLCFYHDGAP